MTTVASKVPFSELTTLLEKIANKQGTENKKRIFQDFVEHWRGFHKKIHRNDPNANDSFYPAMRLLLPHLERERAAYGIKEVMLARLYIEVLCLGKGSQAAEKLLKYRAPKSGKGDPAGDFATVAYFILKNRCPEKGTMTVEEVNECLDDIATNNVSGKKDLVRKKIMYLLRNMSAIEQKWLIRMIMKELKCGLSQQAVFSVFHPDAVEYFGVTTNLEKVCTRLHDPSVRMHEIEITLFDPFRPMLGELAVPNKVNKIMEGKMFYLETKFDGERMQLHKKDDEYKYFSRNGHDYTESYGADPFKGNFTPYIANCFKPHVKNCILDGEMLAIDPETKMIYSKGGKFDVKSVNLEDKNLQPCLSVFDILLLNDRVLTNLTLKERKRILQETIAPVEGRVIVAEVKEARTKEECIEALNEAIDRREEGIMVKNPDTVYKPNVRKGGWFKIKPEYVKGLCDDLDLLVIGGYFGVGGRGGMVSHFLLAVAEPASDGGVPSVFKSFCKVGSGYSRQELYEFNKKLADKWIPFSKSRIPNGVILSREKPDLLIAPQDSCILQVKATEINESGQYATGCTLRFPRVEIMRDDKEWHACMTTEDLKNIQDKADGKLTSRYADAEDEEEPQKKKRKTIQRIQRPTLAAQFKATDTSDVAQVSELFIDKEFCVINGPSAHPKASLEKKIVEYGGTFVQNPGQETFCVLADKGTVMKVRNIAKSNKHDLVKVDWLLKCIEKQKLLPWVPADMFHASPKTEELFAQCYDCYGDSYTDDTTVDQLKKVFDGIEKQTKVEPVSSDTIAEIEQEYFPDESPYGLFRLCRVYLDSNLLISNPSSHIQDSSLEVTALDLQMYGATLSEKLDEDVTHVIVDPSDTSRVQELKDISKRRRKNFYIISREWVDDSIEDKMLRKERVYDV